MTCNEIKVDNYYYFFFCCYVPVVILLNLPGALI